jgi:hypothetical protein
MAKWRNKMSPMPRQEEFCARCERKEADLRGAA